MEERHKYLIVTLAALASTVVYTFILSMNSLFKLAYSGRSFSRGNKKKNNKIVAKVNTFLAVLSVEVP